MVVAMYVMMKQHSKADDNANTVQRRVGLPNSCTCTSSILSVAEHQNIIKFIIIEECTTLHNVHLII